MRLLEKIRPLVTELINWQEALGLLLLGARRSEATEERGMKNIPGSQIRSSLGPQDQAIKPVA